jgi:hypothetical protein
MNMDMSIEQDWSCCERDEEEEWSMYITLPTSYSAILKQPSDVVYDDCPASMTSLIEELFVSMRTIQSPNKHLDFRCAPFLLFSSLLRTTVQRLD